MNDGNPEKHPKTQDEANQYVADRVVWHFERDEVLSEWVKSHDRDVKKLVAELLQRSPTRGGDGQAVAKFDFSKYASAGSGFWISSNGWMVTNEHVVTDAKVVDVRLNDGRVIEAKVMKTDEANDLALLKADVTPTEWLAVSKGAVDLSLGRTVFTVGYPDPMVQGVEPKFTDGRISAASGIGDRKDSYQTTVPVQHGNSGGAMLDFASGWVVGVINARLVSADNVSYAIKSRVVSAFLDSVPEAKDAATKTPAPLPPKGDEQAVIDKATKASALILRKHA
jgi:S1-C subfamily serine protease